MTRSLRAVGIALLVPVVLVLVLWFGTAGSTSFYFPPFPHIVEVFFDLWVFDLVPVHVVPSIIAILLGLFFSILVGVIGGVALGLAPTVNNALDPILQFLRCLPSVALLPLAIQLIGIGMPMKVTVIVLGAVWPILLNTIDGVRGVHPSVLEMARSYRLRPVDRILRVILPAASPQIFAGIRASLSVAVVLMVASELLGSFEGMGFFILEAQRQFSIPEMWSGMILLGIVGYVLNVLFQQAERALLAWHRLSRS